jgi:outer membrane lipoprotein-sorting protein
VRIQGNNGGFAAIVSLRFCLHAVLGVLFAAGGLGCSKEVQSPVCPEPIQSGRDVAILPMEPPGVPGGAAQETVAVLARQWSQVRTFKGHYDSWEKGSDVESSKVDFWLKRPGQYRYEVSQSSVAIKNGSKSVFDTRTRKISSKPGGMLSIVTLQGTLDDARSKSTRGYTLDQSDYATLMDLLTAPQAPVSLMPGRPNVLVLARPSKFRDIESMRATVDTARGILTGVELVVGNQVVLRKSFSAHTVNPALDARKFSL